MSCACHGRGAWKFDGYGRIVCILVHSHRRGARRTHGLGDRARWTDGQGDGIRSERPRCSAWSSIDAPPGVRAVDEGFAHLGVRTVDEIIELFGPCWASTEIVG